MESKRTRATQRTGAAKRKTQAGRRRRSDPGPSGGSLDSSRLDALLAHLPMCAFVKDKELSYVSASRTFARLVGRAPGQIRGATDFDLYSAETAERFQEDDAHVLSTREAVLNRSVPSAHGGGASTSWCLLSKIPYFDEGGEVAGLVGFVVDVTERERLRQEVERMGSALDSFVRAVNDELTNPLSVIRGATEILLGDPGAMKDEVRGLLEAVDASSWKIQASLGALLEISRIGLVAHPREIVSGEEIVQEALDLAGKLHLAGSFRIQLEAKSVDFWVDRKRLVEALVHLIDNAFRHGGDRADPVLTIKTRTEGEWAIVSVGDNGAAFRDDVRAKLFEPFHEGPGGLDGRGLGLFIARRIVESHGGVLSVHAEAGVGNVFEIRLPKVEASACSGRSKH